MSFVSSPIKEGHILAFISPTTGHKCLCYRMCVCHIYSDITCNLLRMPKHGKKGKLAWQEAEDYDFDDMLAELRAADLTTAAATSSIPTVTSSSATSSTSTASTSSSSSTSDTTSTATRLRSAGEEKVLQESILEAARVGDRPRLSRWARFGVQVSSPDPLILAAENGQVDLVRLLVKELGADVNKAASDGYTPLFVAVQEGHVAVIQCLVEELGADVNQAVNDGATPLLIAAESGHLAVVRFLVKLGADVSLRTRSGATPLYVAAGKGHLDILRCLAQELVADVNLARHDGSTPLMLAAQEGHLAAVRFLVHDLGAKVNKLDAQGRSPLFMAAFNGQMEVMRYFVEERGADVNQATHDGSTPLSAASAGKFKKLAAWLIKKGANPQASDLTFGTAADVSRNFGASAEQTAYLEAKMHCSYPGCSGAGIKKCTGCKKARYCGQQCQLAHWPEHKADCKKWSVN
jgi:ankyrin repeat protein